MRNVAASRVPVICLQCQFRQAIGPRLGFYRLSSPARQSPFASNRIDRLSIRHLSTSPDSPPADKPAQDQVEPPASTDVQADKNVATQVETNKDIASDKAADKHAVTNEGKVTKQKRRNQRRSKKKLVTFIPPRKAIPRRVISRADRAAQPKQELNDEPKPFQEDDQDLENIATHLSKAWAEDENVSTFTPSSLKPPSPLTGLDQPPIARLEHGLDRVLFNPGVYRLQDPESRVYNFDASLASLLSVDDFKFEALSTFKPPSRDELLIRLAKTHNARYSGSTSSLTSSLSHFHYLLSAWRPIDMRMLSRNFEMPVSNYSFTQIMRAPGCADLRHRDGHYFMNSISSDDSFPDTFVLSRLGHVIEKLLTHTPQEFDHYKKDNPFVFTPEMREKPEHYHFATRGRFLTRAQLDAYDPRLPGSGTFDIKSRAALSIRMSAMDPADMLGYQITAPYGTFESYEREYHDMLRAIMLKYSLQVRLGNMNGVFVAYHNIQDMFGFQFIPLSEMDIALHGQKSPHMGNQELSASMHLLEQVLDKITARFGTQDVRLWFDTRPTKHPLMYICAQPVTEAEQPNSTKDPWVAILETRSTWNDRPVTRPAEIKSADSSAWGIQYKLTEMPADRAAKLLAKVKQRRAMVLDASRLAAHRAAKRAAKAEEEAEANAEKEAAGSTTEGMDLATAMGMSRPKEKFDPMLDKLRKLAAKGREARERERAKDRGRETVVYKPLS